MPPSAPSASLQDKQKKPRHRHSPLQLAALNELYEKDEHPALELRVSLAERLGMETKTVNAWFQNKRASSKKRTMSRPNAHYDAPSVSHSTSSISRTADMDDYDDDYSSIDYQNPVRSHSPVPSSNGRSWSTFYSGNLEPTQFLTENDNVPRRIRIRPTGEQIEELRKLFSITHHPSAEQRQALAERIGMRYQSITNWFQNQRSLAKKRDGETPSIPSEDSIRQYSAFPPPAPHSLAPRPSHPSLALGRSRRSLSPNPRDELSSNRRSLRRSSTPYSGPTETRPRRTRPEQYQLNALNQLYAKTSHPSIEERSALAQEIGMDLGKVTNWFRNVRQTRKRNKKASAASGDEYEDEYHVYSASASRSGSPSIRSSSSSINDDMMDYEEAAPPSGIISDEGSDDEYEEAVTPSSHRSPSPAPVSKVFGGLNGLPVQRLTLSTLSLAAIDSAEMEKESVRNGIKVEDAMLLLTFHHQVVR
ncbi:homeobox-domain-containing protein [Dendrothele bispora CBS 962.96]|uniref:Homeobox-domain-containing protein n=1 Tax=Dendrothele bispora (strain CBS 962.96) TaxID=1314807 RepID=A0A4S8MTU3_DENBC|nr:homeobox-domain-containing protein [Dendrothele bispora CBS 962.96]